MALRSEWSTLSTHRTSPLVVACLDGVGLLTKHRRRPAGIKRECGHVAAVLGVPPPERWTTPAAVESLTGWLRGESKVLVTCDGGVASTVLHDLGEGSRSRKLALPISGTEL